LQRTGEADYLVWRNAFGSTTILYGSGADGNCDGQVGAADFTVWRNNMSAGGGGSLSVAVPEPSALVLSMLLPRPSAVFGRVPVLDSPFVSRAGTSRSLHLPVSRAAG